MALGSAMQDHEEDIEDMSHYDEEATIANESDSEITLTINEDKSSVKDSIVSVRMVSPEGKNKRRTFRGYSYKKGSRKKRKDKKEDEDDEKAEEEQKEDKNNEENTWQL